MPQSTDRTGTVAKKILKRTFHDGIGLQCPVCYRTTSLKVKDSRQHRNTQFRRRHCTGCKTNFWTKEVYCDWEGRMYGLD